MSLFAELKRRNVFRVAAAYVVTAWLVIQVAETLFPVYGLSDDAVRLVVNLLAIGLVPTIIFAWVFEWTPEGLKKDAEVDHSAPSSLNAAKRLDRIIIAVLVLAIGYFAVDKFVLDPARDASELAKAREEGRSEAEMAVRDSSIAVLAFEDLSPERDQAYFAEGLAIDLMNQLGNVPDLRVSGRTSAFSFRDTNSTIDEIGAALNVGYVMEGSVSNYGNRYRITVALVDTRDGKQVWSETYDRQPEDIFAVRDEIALRVFDRLAVEFEKFARNSIRTDPIAYELTLRARHLHESASTDDEHFRVAEILAEALAIDPDYVPALLRSVYAEYQLVRLGLIDDSENTQFGDRWITRVLEIDPDNGEALGLTAWNEWEGNFNLESTALQMSVAMEKAPGDLNLAAMAGIFARTIGRSEESVALFERCVAADPMNAQCVFHLAQSYLWGNRLQDALAAHRKLESMTEGKPSLYYVVLTLLLLNDPHTALRELQSVEAADRKASSQLLAAEAMVMHDLERHEESAAALSKLTAIVNERYREDTYLLAQAYAWTGKNERAFEWLDKAYELDDRYGVHGYWFHRITYLPIWQPLHADPRWNAFRERMNLGESRMAAIPFEVPPWIQLHTRNP